MYTCIRVLMCVCTHIHIFIFTCSILHILLHGFMFHMFQTQYYYYWHVSTHIDQTYVRVCACTCIRVHMRMRSCIHIYISHIPDAVVLACFNTLIKLRPTILRRWVNILRRAPNSVSIYVCIYVFENIHI